VLLFVDFLGVLLLGVLLLGVLLLGVLLLGVLLLGVLLRVPFATLLLDAFLLLQLVLDDVLGVLLEVRLGLLLVGVLLLRREVCDTDAPLECMISHIVFHEHNFEVLQVECILDYFRFYIFSLCLYTICRMVDLFDNSTF